MSKIIGVTVGTPTSPAKIEKELKPVKTVNGKEPDENGNVEVEGAGGSGTPGKDGFSPIAKVTQTASGATISVTDANGTTTATVTNGKDGADGKTPVKGQDYFTEADKQEIVEEVLEQIPEGGTAELPTVSAIDFSNFENGSFTETVDGETITHDVTFDDAGRPVSIDDVTITWGDV